MADIKKIKIGNTTYDVRDASAARASDLASKQDALTVGNGIAIDNQDTIRTTGIPYGVCDNTSTSTAFTVTVPGIDRLEDGVCCFVKNNKVTSAEGFTLNVNGLGAKPSYSNMATGNPVTPTSPTRDTTIFNINYVMLFVYSSTLVEGGAWICYRGYDANTNTIGYQLRHNSSTLPVPYKFYRYRLLFTSADGTQYIPANASTSTNATAKRDTTQYPINPFGEILYYSSSTAINANATPAATVLWEEYVLNLGYSFNRTGAALVLTYPAPVYLKCAPLTNGSAIIEAETPYVLALPSTNDGKIYILLGIAYSATNIELLPTHPVYYHDGTGIRTWTGKTIPSIAGLATETYVDNAIAALPAPMVFLGTIGTSGTSTTVPNNPTEGDTYKIITGGTSLTFSGITDTIKVGDTVVYKNSTTGWVLIPSGDEPSGTVTNVDMSVPTGLQVSGNPITTSGTLALSYDDGYAIPTTAKQANWDTAYNLIGNKAELFTVNIIYNNSTDSYTSDKTFAQIEDAINDGKIILGKLGGESPIYVIYYEIGTQINFTSTDGRTNEVFIINEDNSVEHILYEISQVAITGSYNDLTNKPTIPTSSDIDAAKPFIVTLSSSNGGDTISCDKTNAEIYAASQSGRDVIVYYGTYQYRPSEISEDYAIFTGVDWDQAMLRNIFEINTSGNIQTVNYSSASYEPSLTFDNTPTQNSNNPVKSGGVYSALQGKEDAKIVNITINRNSSTDALTIYDENNNQLTDAQFRTIANNYSKKITLRYLIDNQEEMVVSRDLLYQDEDYWFFNDKDIYNDYSLTLAWDSSNNTIYIDEALITNIYDNVLYGYVKTNRKINNKPLSADITLTASDVGADVFVVNIERDGNDRYTCDKTNAEIYAAWQANRSIICLYEYRVLILYSEVCSTAASFDGLDPDDYDSHIVIDIYVHNNAQVIDVTHVCYQSYLMSGTNIKTINNQSLLGSGNLTPSSLGVPSLANNLTTTTTGSALDATQGKALKDLIDGITVPQAATATPLVDGTAVVGSSTKYAKEDHVHPTDTSRVPTTRTINGQALSSDITLTANDVGAATSSDISTAISNLVDSAPTTLDTLNELAAALGDDPNFATTVTNQIAAKTIYAGPVAGKLYRNNVGGTGNFTVSGNSGCIPNIPAGTYVVAIYAKSSTQSYTYRFNFGSVTYDLATTNGIINDIRTITLSSAGTFSGMVYVGSVASGSILSVTMYNFQMPINSVGMAAVTNSYNDLNDRPTIPTVNNGTLTIQKNGTTVGTFTANQAGNTTANITVPTVDSSLTDSSQTNPVQGGAIYSALSGKANKNGSDSESFNASGLRVYDNDESVSFDCYYESNELQLSIGESLEGGSLRYTFDDSGDIKYIATTDDLTALTASDVGADVFVVNIDIDNDTGNWVSNKTNAQIYAAWQAGRSVICLLDDEGLYYLVYIAPAFAQFKGLDWDTPNGGTIIKIGLDQTNSQYIEVTYNDLQLALESGTNIKTVNNQSLLGSGNITPSQLGVPNIANNLTTTTTGSTLDATQGKALKDLIDGITVPSASTTTPVMDGTAAIGSSSEYAKADHVHPSDTSKANVITKTTVSTSGAVSLAMTSGVFYSFTGTPTSLTLTLTAPSTGLGIYAGKFTASSTGCTLSVPASVTESIDNPNIVANGTYEFNIMDNVLLMVQI